MDDHQLRHQVPVSYVRFVADFGDAAMGLTSPEASSAEGEELDPPSQEASADDEGEE